MRLVYSLLLVFCALSGCAMGGERYIISPGVRYINLSSSDILNIRGTWAGEPLHRTNIYVGQSASQSLNIRNLQAFYGEVHLMWENAAGKHFEKQFMFTEKDLPPEDVMHYEQKLVRKEAWQASEIPTVTFEFNQEGLIGYYTSSTPGSWERGMEAGKIKNAMRRAYIKQKSNK